MKLENVNKFLEEALAIEEEDAREAGAIGYMARALVQATMPHSKTDEFFFKRVNGAYTLKMIADPDFGLPYGTYPRLLLSWISTEAVRTKSPELELGYTLSAFMAELGLIPTGGRWGTITRLRDQTRRLFSSVVSCVYSDETRDAIRNINIVDDAYLWWDPKAPDQAALWKSKIILGNRFFKEVLKNPVPIDMRALKVLKRSPMALDIYCWMTYRMSYLRKPTLIPWEALKMQFGADYSDDSQGLRNFKKKFLRHLSAVHVVYPEAKLDRMQSGLLLKPSKPHVPMISSR